jgi:glucose-6-phosphate isomerase
MDDLLDGMEAAAGLAVFGGSRAASRRGPRPRFTYPHELLAQIAELHEELADLDTVVVSGPAHAANAMARTVGVPLVVDVLPGPAAPRRTVVVLTEPRPAFRRAYLDLGLSEAELGRHFVVVTDSASLLADAGRYMGAVVVEGDAGTAFSAGSLVPAALAGVDVAELLDQAELLLPSLTSDDDNPALALGAALAAASSVRLVSDGTGLEGLGPWIAGLLGRLPLMVDGPRPLTVTYGGALPAGGVPGGGTRPDIAVNGPLGAQFLAWEYAVASAAHMLHL